MEQGETLEKFLDRVVRPDTEFITNCKQVIDTVVRLIQRYSKYSVNQVIKGGSLGKGTAVRGRSDVDLLVVMNDFKDVEQLKQNMERILCDFSDYLSSAVKKETHGQVELQIKSRTPYTLTFLLRCASDWSWFEVDLLPIVDVWSTWLLGLGGGVKSTYSTMESNSQLRKYYAKSLAKLQVEFVKPVPARVKDLIRLLKYWKNTEQVDLTSYCIELLVIHVWRENGSLNNFTMKALMTKVVHYLATFNGIKITFDDNYDPAYYVRLLRRSPPYVLDPANPFHDLSSDPQWSMPSFRRDCSRIESKGKALQRKLGVLPEESSCVVS